MYLYRCTRKGDFDKECPQYPVVTGNNSYKYEEGVEYIHFFRFAKDAEYYFRRNPVPINSSNYHVGYTVVDIDESEISKYLGYGIYVVGQIQSENEMVPVRDIITGEVVRKVQLENYENIYRPILEYAIPKKLYDEFNEKYFFNVKEEYSKENNNQEKYYNKIPDEFRNDVEYEEYMDIINKLNIKYDGNAELIGEEVLSQYQIEIKKK